MAHHEVWVHGHSGHLDTLLDEEWGRSIHDGSGLYLEANVQVKLSHGGIQQKTRRLYAHFHLPTPTSAEGVVRLRRVMLRFSTDSDPAGMQPDATATPPYFQTNKGFEKYRMDGGGAIIDALDVYDAEKRIGAWTDLAWQSSGLRRYVVETLTMKPELPVRYGVGISAVLVFRNQHFVEKQLLEPKGGVDPDKQAHFPIDKKWNGKPWLNKGAATNLKSAWLSSVGCEFVTAGP